jgi:uncharacterized protein YbcV (DUF1398 family)
MEREIIDTIERCAAASHAGTIHFGEVVAALLARGIESYRVDFRECAAHYYLPSGATHRIVFRAPVEAIAQAFNKAGIEAAIRAAQAGTLMYPGFVERAVQSGCVGYVVWLAGRHVTYQGRRGEQHVEPFPPSAA